ncbi:hypothetical protein, partial [Prosthecochloris sp. ZM_2]|uniref:hypothetical protein n=1 Tax=Prosthecochloris sp. ZM_2 TaxID=2045206 RepID=UPI001F279BE2
MSLVSPRRQAIRSPTSGHPVSRRKAPPTPARVSAADPYGRQTTYSFLVTRHRSLRRQAHPVSRLLPLVFPRRQALRSPASGHPVSRRKAPPPRPPGSAPLTPTEDKAHIRFSSLVTSHCAARRILSLVS